MGDKKKGAGKNKMVFTYIPITFEQYIRFSKLQKPDTAKYIGNTKHKKSDI
jgi:hypothetical protein